MPTENASIQAIIDNRVAGVRAKDVAQATQDYSPDVVVYDLVEPLQRQSLPALQARLREWLSSLAEVRNFEIRTTQLQANDAIAYVISLNHIDALTVKGTPLDMWWRETTCYELQQGRWLITHTHSSVPFNMENGQARLDLKPELP